MGAKAKEGMGICAVQVLGAVFAEGGVGVGLVEDDALHEARECGDDLAIASGLQCGEGLGVYLEVPGIVGLAFVEDRLGGSESVAAALEDDAVEKGLVSVVVGVAFVDGQFVGGELDDAVGARAQGGEVLIIAARGRGADTIGELGLAENRCPGTDEGDVGVGGGGVEGYLDGRVVQGLHGSYVGE